MTSEIGRSAEPARPADRPAGFAIRLSAATFDAALVIGAALLARDVAAAGQRYVPLESLVVVLLPLYASLLTAWRGATLGKALCGLRVRRTDGRPAGPWRSLARETVGRLLSTVLLGAGYLPIALGRSRRGWHDRLAGTRVTSAAGLARRACAVAAASAGLLLGVGAYVESPLSSYLATREMAAPADAPRPWERRDPSSLREVGTLGETDEQRVATWLDRNGQDPLAYLVARAAEHSVVLLGEMHEQGGMLRWFNEAIPALHARAGVTCVAMEVCLARDDAAIGRLVGGATFDRDLALEIARHQPSGLWGWKEYWDVLETVWRVNHEAPAGAQRLRLIGLDKPMDVPSMVMMGLSDMRLEGLPRAEWLRAWRLPQLAAVMMLRDGAMAREIEEQVLRKGERAVVLVGQAHATTAGGQPGRDRWGSMGRMLRCRHGDAIFQVRMHSADIPASLVDPRYAGPPPALAAFLERVMARRDRRPVAFDVGPSPLAGVRDDAALEYHGTPGLALADTALGYVYLRDWREIEHCRWLPGYVSEAMFVRDEPMYEALGRLVGVRVSKARDMDVVGERLAR